MTKYRLVATALVVIAGVAGVRTVWLLACGPFISDVETISTFRPAHMEDFVRGELGLVRPSFPRRYLVQAYRVMKGLPPLTTLEDVPTDAAVSTDRQLPSPELWQRIRDGAVGPPADASARSQRTKQYRLLAENYQSFVNCQSDAFDTAVKTLHARIEQFGRGSAAVREWADAQDHVFMNCSEGPLVLPTAPSGPDPINRADHEYQVAAAYLYGTEFEEAARRFHRIADDSNSPWQPYGQYLAARAVIRQATIREHEPAKRDELFAQAAAELQRVLGDRRTEALHDSARGLLDFIAVRLNRVDQTQKLALKMATAASVTEQELTDYKHLMDQLLGNTVVFQYDKVPDRERIVASHELNDWILTLQGRGDGAAARAIDRMSATGSPIWLISTLWNITPDHVAVPEVLEHAAKLERSSPAFPTVSFLRVRLLLELGRQQEARAILETLPQQPQPGFGSDVINAFSALRFRAAQSLDELLTHASRLSLDPEHPGQVFDDDAGAVLSLRLPLHRLVEASSSRRLPVRLRTRVAAAAFARAFFLGRPNEAQAAARQLSNLSLIVRSDMERYLAGTSDEARHQAGLLVMLRTPGMHAYVRGRDDSVSYDVREPGRRFDHMFRRNWWCGQHLESQENGWSPGPDIKDLAYPYQPWPYPAFITDSERAVTRQELLAVAAKGLPQGYLAEEAIKWAQARPTDLQAAEALALAVEGGRWSCGISESSRRAFHTLHQVFPQSEWARRTKYWYRSYP